MIDLFILNHFNACKTNHGLLMRSTSNTQLLTLILFVVFSKCRRKAVLEVSSKIFNSIILTTAVIV